MISDCIVANLFVNYILKLIHNFSIKMAKKRKVKESNINGAKNSKSLKKTLPQKKLKSQAVSSMKNIENSTDCKLNDKTKQNDSLTKKTVAKSNLRKNKRKTSNDTIDIKDEISNGNETNITDTKILKKSKKQTNSKKQKQKDGRKQHKSCPSDGQVHKLE